MIEVEAASRLKVKFTSFNSPVLQHFFHGIGWSLNNLYVRFYFDKQKNKKQKQKKNLASGYPVDHDFVKSLNLLSRLSHDYLSYSLNQITN
jgi:hypothetical protein